MTVSTWAWFGLALVALASGAAREHHCSGHGRTSKADDFVCTCMSGRVAPFPSPRALPRVALPPRLPWLTGQPDLLIDMATLTGAQLIATGKRHAGIVANTDEVEASAVLAGRHSGDLVHPQTLMNKNSSYEMTNWGN